MLTFRAARNAVPGSTDSLCAVALYAERRDTFWFRADILERAPDARVGEIAELPLPFPRDLSELRVDPEALARAEFIRRYQWPVKALLFLLGAFALWAFLRWYERRRARFVAELEQRDRPPYVWQLETGEEGAPDFGEGLTLLLNRLRRRESADLQRLDLRATVRASVRNAGRAAFRFREQTRPPEYLLLIDRYDANDHSARWFDAFFRELVRAEIPVWRYFYQGDPRVCFDEAHPQGIALGELLHRHRDARLLLFGEGQRLLSPASGLLAPWTTLFAGWRRRALLLTKPGRDWGRREQTLSALFAVSPASVKGIDLALEQFETLAQRSPAEALRRTDDAFDDPIVFEGSLLRTLERHFPPALLRWIAACAVYPALHWDLTLFLGSTLSEPGQAPLGSADNLRQLLRLPWFAQGRIPDNARLQLIEYLAAQGLETRVRKALDELLRRAPAPPPDSVAWDEHRMNVVLNELLLTTDKKRRRALEAEFERFLATGKQPDFVTFKQLLRKPTALDLVVPDRWKKHFFRHSTSRFGLRRPAWWGLGALLLGLGLTLAPVKPRVCSGETTTYQGQTLCLETPADELLYLEFLAYDAIEAQNHPLADSLRRRVGPISRKALPPADTLPFYRNTAVRSFNYAARAYNCSLRPTPGCPGRSADSLRQEACENFRRAAVLYAAVGEQRVEFAIALQQACPGDSSASVPEGPVLRGQVLDALSGKPLPGASVRAADAQSSDARRLREGRGEGIFPALTDQQGRYVLRGLPAATELLLYASAPGYAPTETRTPPLAELPPLRLKASKQALEEAAWQQALETDTPEGYGAYLAQFPNGRYAAEARRRQQEGLSAKERALWDAATRENSIASYENYLRRYPDGAFRAEAEKAIQDRREEAAWQQALATNTPAAYETYRRTFPNGRHAAEALERISALREEAAWQQALAANTPAAYQAYVAAWPKGRYADEARKRLEPTPPEDDVIIEALVNKMVRVRGGTFTMGCTKEQGRDCADDEKPAHRVTVSDFSIGTYEVTQQEWRAVMGSNPSNFKNCDACPVENVSWDDIQEFLSRLNAKTGRAYRLPTEAEWEYAARGGSQSRGYKYAGSNSVDEVAWYTSNSGSKTHPVGQKKANELGLYDMSGNVYEWCADDWHDNYSGAPSTGRAWIDSPRASYRVYRGGSWDTNAQFCRVSCRDSDTPSIRNNILGFRLAL